MKTNTETTPPLLFGVTEAAKRLSMSATTIRELVRRGELEGRKAGTRLLIPSAAIDAYAASLPRAGGEG